LRLQNKGQIATRTQDDLQNRFTLHKLKKSSVIPHPDAESAESWLDVRQELQSKMVLKAKQIPRRGMTFTFLGC